MTDPRQLLSRWLRCHDNRLNRFAAPLPISTVAMEAEVDAGSVLGFLTGRVEPICHIWQHNSSRSKPYCLRLNGPDTVGLDWEESVVGAAEAEFQRRGYQTIREFGDPWQVRSITATPDLSRHTPGSNQRDLWALRRTGDHIDLFIIEAKGKQAYEFDHYCLAELLSQVFAVSGEHLTALIGAHKDDSHGLCWQYAQQIHAGWSAVSIPHTITVAILVPEWTPDVVWTGGQSRSIPECFYARPLTKLRRFLVTGQAGTGRERYKYERAFAGVLSDLQDDFDICTLAASNQELRFRLLTTAVDRGTRQFELNGLD